MNFDRQGERFSVDSRDIKFRARPSGFIAPPRESKVTIGKAPDKMP